MDLLYSRYASPDRFMKTYIDQGRFGEFVANIIEMDMERKKEAVQKIKMINCGWHISTAWRISLSMTGKKG